MDGCTPVDGWVGTRTPVDGWVGTRTPVDGTLTDILTRGWHPDGYTHPWMLTRGCTNPWMHKPVDDRPVYTRG